MKNLNLFYVLITAVFAFSLYSSGEMVRVILDDSSATASTSYANRYPRYAVNGAGLTNGQHSAQGGDYLTWLSANDTNPVSKEWFRIDLGEVIPIHHVKIWNFNWDHLTVATEQRGIKDVEFYVSTSLTDPGHYYTNSVLWTLVTNTVVAEAPGLDTYTGEPDISMYGVEGRWLLMHPLTNHGGETYAGISEIQVFKEVISELPGWNKHLQVTFSGYSGASTLEDFPCVLRLSEDIPGFEYSSFSSPSDGADLRLATIYGDPLEYEIEKWDPSGTSIVWVAVDELKTNKQVIAHWNNPDAEMPDYATNGTFWADTYGGVWHLDQSDAVDSTTNRNDGTANGNITVPGLLGEGQYFDGNDYVQVPDDASIGENVISNQTISMWFKSDDVLVRTNEVHRLLEKGDCYFIAGGYQSKGGVSYIVKRSNSAFAAGNGEDVSSNQWHHVCATYDRSYMRIYVDGVYEGNYSLTGAIDDDHQNLRIGSDDDGKYFKGVIDETRIESVRRSSDWIKASYDSQKEASDFLEYSAVYPAGPLPLSGTLILIQ